MERDHLCQGCTASVVDHAVVCPWLGVIAAGRHRRIKAMDGEAALQYVSFQSTANKLSHGRASGGIKAGGRAWAEERSEHRIRTLRCRG